jgi:uncharacterized membrane protein YdjX (TVP38/TMEM64 family)
MNQAVVAPSRDPTEPPSQRNAKIAAVAVVAAGLALARWAGVFDQVGEPARLAKSLVDLGAWGYLAFVIAYAALQPFGLPGTVFVFAAPLIWPWPVAFGLSMVGTMAASVVGFSFCRFIARDWISKRIPARFRKYDEALATRAFATVFLLRLVFWMPPLLHAFFGVSKVRFWTHFWGSLAGYVLPLLLVSYLGQQVWGTLKDLPPRVWLGALAALAVVALAVWVGRRSLTRRNGSA